jgi:hypothetical protein
VFGDVGIGTTSPTNKLTVIGRSNFIGRVGILEAVPGYPLHVRGKIVSGLSNSSTGLSAALGGGSFNFASGNHATVSGGESNAAIGYLSTISGGYYHSAPGVQATISGGWNNSSSGNNSTISGGYYNTASGIGGAVSGGFSNTATGTNSSVSGGRGNDATGDHSSVSGGQYNLASGNFSFAIGRRSQATHNGSFVWGDSTQNDKGSSQPNEFNVYAERGMRVFAVGQAAPSMVVSPLGQLGLGTDAPAQLLSVNGTAGKPGGGSWTTFSDRRLKKNIRGLDGALSKLLALRGVSFEFKDPAAHNELSGERIGFIAQEVEGVVPDWVEENASGYKQLTIRGFEALTVEALRELEQKNSRLRAENAAQLQRFASLESKQKQLEQQLRRLLELELERALLSDG